MPNVPVAAALEYEALVSIRRKALAQARRAWREVSPAYISESWSRVAPTVTATLIAAQVEAASVGVTYGAFALAEQGKWVAPTAFADPRSFGGGWSSSGAPLDEALALPAIRTKTAIAQGAGTMQALATGWQALAGVVSLQVADAGRVAAGIDVAARPRTGYVRMLNPPSCDRCVVLAGKWFRWNAGFRRHPSCDCVHVISTAGSTEGALREGLIDDPYDYFRSLSEGEQDRVFGRYQAEAIRDGADIYQVINSRRGRMGAFTTEGTTRRGHAGGLLRPGQRRMTPEAIYRLHPRREDALRVLREHGYILPGGQVPGGSLRGVVEGYGQMGRGGTRVGARRAIEEARRTGVRDPRSRYTMTAAERRLFDAEARYTAVLQGRNPFGRAPLTPQIAASVEADYRRWLLTGGQVF